MARLEDLPIKRTDLFKCMFEFLISRGKSSRLERFGLTKPFGSPETTQLGPSFSNLSARPPPPSYHLFSPEPSSVASLVAGSG